MSTDDVEPVEPVEPDAGYIQPEITDGDHTWFMPAESLTSDGESDGGHPTPTSWQRRVGGKAAVVVALVAVGAAAGAGITHAVTSNSAPAASSAAAPPSNGSNGSGGTGSGTNGNSATGNGFGGSGSGGTSGGYGFFGNGGPFSGGSSGGSGTSGGSASSSSNQSDGPTDAAAIAKDADAGIVDITTTIVGGQAAGTGMVLTSTGEILTNNHVINGATSISVRDVGNGKTYKATVVGYDRTQDVAVLQLVNASGLTTVKTATSEPSSGAAVVAVGNAGGTGGTPSYAGGAITGVGKTITASDQSAGTSEKLTGLLATDADIEAGDSGGPLVDTAGEVVGMDTAASSSGGGFGFGEATTTSRGFAIPILTALSIVDEIESGDASSTVHIGTTAQLGVYVSSASEQVSGAVVEQAAAGGGAAKAGIVGGDIITAVNGVTIATASQLTAEMSTLSPGQTVAVTYSTSGGAHRTVRVTLGTGAPQ